MTTSATMPDTRGLFAQTVTTEPIIPALARALSARLTALTVEVDAGDNHANINVFADDGESAAAVTLYHRTTGLVAMLCGMDGDIKVINNPDAASLARCVREFLGGGL